MFNNTGNSWREGGHQRSPWNENSGGVGGGCKSKKPSMGGVWIRFLEPHRVNRLLQQRSPGGGGGR